MKIIRKYLLCVFIATPQPEHAKIKEVIKRISKDDCEFIKFHKDGVSVFFSTELVAGQIEAALDTCALSDDKRLIVEIGSDYHTFGLNHVHSWLQRHSLKAP